MARRFKIRFRLQYEKITLIQQSRYVSRLSWHENVVCSALKPSRYMHFTVEPPHFKSMVWPFAERGDNLELEMRVTKQKWIHLLWEENRILTYIGGISIIKSLSMKV